MAAVGAPASTQESGLQCAAELQIWDDVGWEAWLRGRLASGPFAVPGPCVLDVSEDVILSYPQSDFALVEQDLRAAFPQGVARKLEDAIRDEVTTCLTVRRELINYKKLCLHMWKAGSTVEKDLRQLASFFYIDLVAETPSEEQRKLYSDVSNTMNECRGAVSVIWDARYFGKAICNLPRHPDSGVPWKFEELPESLEVWKSLERARQFVSSHAELDAYLALRWGRRMQENCSSKGAAGEETAEYGAEASMPSKPPAKKDLAWKSERVLVQSPLSTDGLHELLKAIKSTGLPLPRAALRYIELVLIARGMSKAMTLRTTLRRYCVALRQVQASAEEVRADLRNLLDCQPSETSASAGLHSFCEKYWRMMSGVVAVVPEMLQWLEPISELHGDAERLFVSGAKGAAAFVPRGFSDLLQPYRAFAKEHRGRMLEALSKGKWPKSARPNAQEEINLLPCRHCGEKYTRLWLHRELCFVCEARLRSEGRCPFNDKCAPASFCPHERLCAVCEQHSCEECRLLRGDGEDVWQVVGHWQPAAVFLDFDRTLATTKRGGSPLIGNHSVDPDLATVCGSHGCVQIVTRSSRKEDILQFLAQKGVPISRVHSLKRDGWTSKSQVIVQEMAKLEAQGGRGLFVDDDIKELTDPGLQPLVDAGRLQRFLFVRAGGKE
mmetsp:Transcript_3686/g.13616  ORF Transcript_3686/g.13616 Transcript_3686/m.13616 type:complete len:666 (-) Transcript_3686:106-2103(-)